MFKKLKCLITGHKFKSVPYPGLGTEWHECACGKGHWRDRLSLCNVDIKYDPLAPDDACH